MVLGGSCKHIGLFLTGLYEGKYDGVIQEIDAQEMKNMSSKSIFEYPKFNMSDVSVIYAREKVQQDNILRAASSGSPPVDVPPQEEQELPPQAQDEQAAAEEEEEEVSKAEQKERVLKEAREKHVRAAMQQLLRLVVRPTTKNGYETLLKESALIQNRSSLASALGGNVWRHGWIYDAGSDKEPQLSESSNRSIWSWPPQPDVPVMTQFFQAALGELDEVHDIFLTPSSRSQSAHQEFKKVVVRCPMRDDLHINYKECPKRGPRNSMEIVYAAHSKRHPGQRDGPRKVFTATTLASNCMVQVDDFSATSGSQPAAALTVTRECKENILGPNQLTTREKGLAPTGTVFLFHWEKTTATWMEIFHHYGLTSIATCTAGRFPLLIAAVVMNVRALIMCKNEEHRQLLDGDVFAWMLRQSETDEEASFFVSRGQLIEQYGLEADEAPAPPASAAPGQPLCDSKEEEEEDDENGEGEEGAELEFDDLEDPEGEESEKQEDSEEDPEGEEGQEGASGGEEQTAPQGSKRKAGDGAVEPKAKAKGKAKAGGKAKAKGKGKAKAKSKAKAKGEAKAKAKGKAKPKAKAAAAAAAEAGEGA